MNTFITIVASIFVLVLLLISVFLIGRVVLQAVLAYVEHRRREARRATLIVPGLGQFSSCDDTNWIGRSGDLQILISSGGGAPSRSQAIDVNEILQNRDGLIKKAKAFIASHENIAFLSGGIEQFHAQSLDYQSTSRFSLCFGHLGDPDGMYDVEFVDGEPVDSVRND